MENEQITAFYKGKKIVVKYNKRDVKIRIVDVFFDEDKYILFKTTIGKDFIANRSNVENAIINHKQIECVFKLKPVGFTPN